MVCVRAEEAGRDDTSRSGSGGSKGGGSSSGSKPAGLKRLRRLKIRYVGAAKGPIEAIEEAWAAEGVDFPS